MHACMYARVEKCSGPQRPLVGILGTAASRRAILVFLVVACLRAYLRVFAKLGMPCAG